MGDKTLVCPQCGHILATLCVPYGINLPNGTTLSCYKCDGVNVAEFKDGWFEWRERIYRCEKCYSLRNLNECVGCDRPKFKQKYSPLNLVGRSDI